MRMLRRFLTPLFAASLTAALAGTAWAQAPAPKPAAPLLTVVPELPPLANLHATRERPLFVRTRRPPAVVEKAAEPETAEQVVTSDEAPADLIGIVVGPERTYAILKDHENKEVQHLQKGEKIEDWSLDEIAPRYIVLRRGATKMHVELFDQKEADASHGKPRDEDDEDNVRPRRPAPPRPRVNRPAAPRFAQPQRRVRNQPQRRPRREP